jgi:hypothetical protein
MPFALTPLSAENRLNVWLNESDCSASAFAKIFGIPATAIDRGLQGHTAFSNERSVEVTTGVSELRALQDSIGGIPINFSNPSVIRKILDERRRLSRVTPAPTAFNVRVGEYWLVENTKYTGLVTTMFPIMASKMTRAVADEVVAELKRRGLEHVDAYPSPTSGSGTSFERVFGLEEKSDPTISKEYEPQ